MSSPEDKAPGQAHDRTKSKAELPKLKPMVLEGYKLDIDYFLKTHYVSVSSANAELPSVIEWVNEQLATATEQKHLAKAALKEAEGNAYHALREENFWRQQGFTGKITEAAIERAIPLLDSVQQANRVYAELAGRVVRLSNTIISLQAKLDLVRSTEATRRSLVEGDAGRSAED